MSPSDLEAFRSELARDDLSIYTAVRLARLATDLGDVSTAIGYLRVDADKIRGISQVLYRLVMAN